jgi:surface polysaccharide O-acyltransferase-like enzyme
MSSAPKMVDTHIDFIKSVAIVLVILIHSCVQTFGSYPFSSQSAWWTANVYDSLARVSVPLFVLASGALLLGKDKIEPLRSFFKKRSVRIVLPFFVWVAVYFLFRFFVNGETLTINVIIQGTLTGPYYHFWFVYMLFGLLLATPLLRVFISYANATTIYYVIGLAFFSSAILPILSILSGYSLLSNILLPTGWVGYYLLGAMIRKTKTRLAYPITGFIVGTLIVMSSTFWLTSVNGGVLDQFTYDFLSAPVVLASVSAFLLLKQMNIGNPSKRTHVKILRAVSASTFSIYMVHPLLIDVLERGLLGFQINALTIPPIIEIPLLVLVVFTISFALAYTIGVCYRALRKSALPRL